MDIFSKARYFSPQIQNELIDICGEVIVEKLVQKVNEAQCFAILADETTNIAGIEQFSLCARYLEKVNSKMILK